MMTGTELFTKAHKIARETRASFVTYRAAFSAALKGLYAMMKENEKSTAEKLEEIGLTAWERGEMTRYYLNRDYAVARAAGFVCGSDGKWTRGEGRISSRSMDTILATAYYDAKAGRMVYPRNGGFAFATEKEIFSAAIAAL